MAGGSTGLCARQGIRVTRAVLKLPFNAHEPCSELLMRGLDRDYMRSRLKGY